MIMGLKGMSYKDRFRNWKPKKEENGGGAYLIEVHTAQIFKRAQRDCSGYAIDYRKRRKEGT